MKTLVYSIHEFEKPFLVAAAAGRHPLKLLDAALSAQNAAAATGFESVAIFTADDASAPVLDLLHGAGVKFLAIRAAGHDNVDLPHAARLGLKIANVPAYSPNSVAEHAVALILALNRKLITADRQVHAWNFCLDNLVGFDLSGKTVGLIGTGKIGGTTARILHGFGCRLLGYDAVHDSQLEKNFDLEYVDLPELCRQSDIISLHTSLNPGTRHLINEALIARMKQGVMLINTSRGPVVNTDAVLAGLESGRIGALGLDVYEFEKGLFFADQSARSVRDARLARLLAMPNVLITGHQAFLTREALRNIAASTAQNLDCWQKGVASPNELIPAHGG